jgi:hypothetical protein
MLAHQRQHLPRRLPAMAVLVFNVHGQLSKRFTETRYVHDGVKPKSVVAYGLAGDFSDGTSYRD